MPLTIIHFHVLTLINQILELS